MEMLNRKRTVLVSPNFPTFARSRGWWLEGWFPMIVKLELLFEAETERYHSRNNALIKGSGAILSSQLHSETTNTNSTW